jgi:hypothetical protein
MDFKGHYVIGINFRTEYFLIFLQTLSLQSIQSYLANCKLGNYVYFEERAGGEGVGIIRKM